MESVKDTELKAFFSYVVQVLDDLGIPYMIVGGFAAIFYGEPRATTDVDILVDMQRKHVESFVKAFPIPDFYASKDGILDSLFRRYPFNVIQPTTGAKIDMVPLPRDAFSRASFQRRKQIPIDETGRLAYFIAPEDIVIAKLIAFRATGSDKHSRDARGVMLIQKDELNWDELRKNAVSANVAEALEELIQTL